jgi:hypothetical protein
MTRDLGRRDRMVAMYARGAGTEEIAAEFSIRTPAARMALIRAGVYRPGPRANNSRSPEASARTAMQIEALAEYVAEGGTPTGWSREAGIDGGRARQLWSRIKREMGAQAI